MESFTNSDLIFCRWSEIVDYVIIVNTKTNKKYRWFPPEMNFINKDLYVASILHNSENMAMLDFTIVGSPTWSAYRMEINPLEYTGDSWVADV